MHQLPIGAHLGIRSTSCVLGRREVRLLSLHSLGFDRSGCRELQVLGLGWWRKVPLKKEKDGVVVRIIVQADECYLHSSVTIINHKIPTVNKKAYATHPHSVPIDSLQR